MCRSLAGNKHTDGNHITHCYMARRCQHWRSPPRQRQAGWDGHLAYAPCRRSKLARRLGLRTTPRLVPTTPRSKPHQTLDHAYLCSSPALPTEACSTGQPVHQAHFGVRLGIRLRQVGRSRAGFEGVRQFEDTGGTTRQQCGLKGTSGRSSVHLWRAPLRWKRQSLWAVGSRCSRQVQWCCGIKGNRGSGGSTGTE